MVGVSGIGVGCVVGIKAYILGWDTGVGLVSVGFVVVLCCV